MRHAWSLIGYGCGLVLAAGPLAAAEAVLFASDFESGVLNDPRIHSQSQGWQSAGTVPTITQERARDGKYGIKMYLNKNTSETPYRTMLQAAWGTTTDASNRVSEHVPYFEDSWIGFSVFLPETGSGNWNQTSDTYEVIAQWHDSHYFPPPSWDTEESKNPLFSMQVTDTTHQPARHWVLTYLGEGRTPFPTQGTPRPWQYESSGWVDVGSIDNDVGKWTDWVIRIRWNFWKVGTNGNSARFGSSVSGNVAGSPDAGLIQVWKNGKLVLDRSPVQIGSHDNAGPTFSVGLYKGWRTAQDRSGDPVPERTIFFDAFKYGGKDAKYADVAPGGAATPDQPMPKPPSNVQIDR